MKDGSFGAVQREVVSRAPLRLSFAGGGTDVPPYPELYGGAVLSATINRFAYCRVRIGESEKIRVTSYDLGTSAEFTVDVGPEFDGNLDLVKAVFKRINVDRLMPMDITLHCDVPPGSGLGSSSAIVVALITALSKFLGISLSRHELAHIAYLVEREDVGISGGSQDHFASAYGGFNYMEFGSSVDVVPLRLEPYQICELESQILLAYVGETRLSSGIIEEQTKRFLNNARDSMTSLHRMRELASEARSALLADQYLDFARCIEEGWQRKRLLANSITSPMIEKLYSAGLAAGALAGKLLGAGGGGHLLFCVPSELRGKVSEALEVAGARVGRNINLGSSGSLAWERRANVARLHESFRR